MFDSLSQKLQALLQRLPQQPGVYLFKDRHGKVVYVGKANNLRVRVRSYFTRSGDTRAFVRILAGVLGDIETVVTSNETEALLLENNLIKEHRPRFNVKLRDDKSYLVLRLDPRQTFPRLEVTRKIADDGVRYFGPYHSARACRDALRTINRYFQLRTCTDHVMQSRSRPCLQFQIGRCPAPCVQDVDTVAYARQVEDVTLFLRGRNDQLIANLQQRMTEAASELDYELAAQLRDKIAALRNTLNQQEVVGADLIDQDVFAFWRQGDAIDFVVLNLRAGKLISRKPYSFSGIELSDAEAVASFVNQYYDAVDIVPKQILVPVAFDDAAVTGAWLSERAGRRVTIAVPQRGKRKKLVDLAARNARSNFETKRERHEDRTRALSKLQQRLRLKRFPARIECYDISGFQGQHVVGSMVVMVQGVPDTKQYRQFTVRGKTDDFGALYEVLSRRFRRARNNDTGWALPDLIVIDGGRGQLSVVQAALKDVGVLEQGDVPDLVALAKERTPTDESQEARPDRVFVGNAKDPLRLNPNTAELYLLAQIRDEAHRFAVRQHTRKRGRVAFKSELDAIPGIGPERKRAMLRTLGSVKAIRSAELQQLADVPGMNLRAAEAVVRYFAAKGEND